MSDQSKLADGPALTQIGDGSADRSGAVPPNSFHKLLEEYLAPLGYHPTVHRNPGDSPGGFHLGEGEESLRFVDPPYKTLHPSYLKELEITDPPAHFHRPSETWPELTKTITPQRVEEVRTSLEKDVSDLIPAQEKALLKQLRDGALDSNPQAIQEAYMSLKGDPQKLQAMVKELNHEFNGLDSNVRFSVIDGNRLVLTSDNKNGVVFSDKGTSAARVTKGGDGFEYISQSQEGVSSVPEVMKGVRKGLCEQSPLFIDPVIREIYRHHSPDPNLLRFYDLPGHLDFPSDILDLNGEKH
jgi:hypothetical protein